MKCLNTDSFDKLRKEGTATEHRRKRLMRVRVKRASENPNNPGKKP